ncbi:MAG: hypothetical protein ACE5Q6_01865 [Dehalococcoidia bacterium]
MENGNHDQNGANGPGKRFNFDAKFHVNLTHLVLGAVAVIVVVALVVVVAKINAIDARLGDLTVPNDSSGSEVRLVAGTSSEMQEKVETIDESISNLKQSLQSTRQDLATITSQNELLKQDTESIISGLEDANKLIGSLKEDIQAHIQKAPDPHIGLGRSISDIKIKVQGLRTDLEEAVNDIDSTQENIETLVDELEAHREANAGVHQATEAVVREEATRVIEDTREILDKILKTVEATEGLLKVHDQGGNGPPPPPITPKPTPTPTPTPTPPPGSISVEGESGTGNGQAMPRENASGELTILLHADETRNLPFQLSVSAEYTVKVRYSNDNFGPLETVTITIDGTNVGSFIAQDTGDHGDGWNVFFVSEALGPVSLASGNHTLVISVGPGDGYGVEIDLVTVQPVE